MSQVAAPSQDRLCQAHQQLPAHQPPLPLLELAHSLHRRVQSLHQVQLRVQVPDQQQSGVAGERGIVSAAVNGRDGCATLHLLGASCLEPVVL